MKEYYCKRCGDQIPAASPDGLKIVYLGTVGANNPDVPEDIEGLCFPCLGEDAPTAGETMNSFNESIEALSEVL